MNISFEDLDRLEEAYSLASSLELDAFVFENSRGEKFELLTSYAAEVLEALGKSTDDNDIS